jgi:phage tail-like protein
MQVTQKDYLNYLYEKLPPVYRDYDAKLKYPLKRYLECIVTGAFKPTLDLISSMLLLLDPEKCPIQYLPYLCQSFGVTYHPEVEERFQRKYLKNIIEIYKRKGTHSIIAFIAREIVGFEVYTYEAQLTF